MANSRWGESVCMCRSYGENNMGNNNPVHSNFNNVNYKQTHALFTNILQETIEKTWMVHIAQGNNGTAPEI